MVENVEGGGREAEQILTGFTTWCEQPGGTLGHPGGDEHPALLRSTCLGITPHPHGDSASFSPILNLGSRIAPAHCKTLSRPLH